MSNRPPIFIQHAEYVDPRAGNDKFYRVVVAGSSWVTQYGRNGTLGTLTKPVDAGTHDAAVAAAGKKFDAKVKKGYTPTRQGTLEVTGFDLGDAAAVDTLVAALPADGSIAVEQTAPIDLGHTEPVQSRVGEVTAALNQFGPRKELVEGVERLPIRPMLASVQPESRVEALLDDGGWVAQFKYDGDRAVVEVDNGQVRVCNRNGQPKVRHFGTAHLAPFAALDKGRWVFDGELVGRTYVVFDLAYAHDGENLWITEADPFIDRRAVLGVVADVLNIGQEPEAPVVTAMTHHNSRYLLRRAVAEQREGIILREENGPYEPGRRSTGLVKVKLTKDADVIVTALHGTKQSATLSVHGPDGGLVEVGAASTIGKGHVRVGQVWKVVLLYVTDPAHPRLFQPVLVESRTDKAAWQSDLAQFADAGTTKAV